MSSPATLLVRAYADALADEPFAALAALVVAGATALPDVRAAVGKLSPRARLAVLAALGVAALAWAWHLAWLCDDAFISFRYARNLARGNGLVWNVGERVEGYTNFLWTVLEAGAIGAGLHPGQAALVLGLASHVGVLALLVILRRRLVPAERRLAVPLAAALFAANYTAASFATSGLETMAAAFAVTLAIERALAGRALAAGAAATAAIFLHPDHALFELALGAALVAGEQGRARRVRVAVAYALPAAVLYVPYFCARWAYYGDVLPNTFHAKAADGWYVSQGALYVFASLLGGGLWGALPAALRGLSAQRRTLLGRYVAVAFPLYLAYIAKIGGDFMFGRLFVALLPPLFLLVEIGVSELVARGRGRAAVVSAVVAGVAAIPAPTVPAWEVVGGIADERTFSPLASFSPIVVDSATFRRARLLHDAFTAGGLRPTLADSQIGMLGYETDLEVVDCHGLTDRVVAGQPALVRSRPGHEKNATPAYLLSRGVALSRMPLYPDPWKPLARVAFRDHSHYSLAAWDPALVEALRQSGAVTLPDPVGYLDAYLTATPGAPRDLAPAAVLAFFDPFYFAANHDPERRARLAALVR